MESTPRLYDTLVHILRQHQTWLDRRHLKTLAWMMVGLIQSGTISVTAWVPYVHSRALFAQSTVRRFAHRHDHHRRALPVFHASGRARLRIVLGAESRHPGRRTVILH